MYQLTHGGQVVATGAMLAEKLGCTTDVLSDNFNNNRSRYSEGEHYFHLSGDVLRQFKGNPENFRFAKIAPNINQLYLWTERGAFNHVKSLGTDEAWNAFKHLVDTYFKARDIADQKNSLPNFSDQVAAARAWADQVEARMLAEARADELASENYQLGLITEYQETEIKKVAPKAKHYDKVMKADGVLTVSQIAVDLGFRKAADLNSYLKRKKVIKKVNDVWVLTAEYTGNHYTKPVAHTYQGSGGVEKTKEHTYWTQRGKEFLMEFIRLNPESQKKVVKPMLYHQLTI